MNSVLILIPSHSESKVIPEWAAQFEKRKYKVFVRSVDDNIATVNHSADIVIYTSPHCIHLSRVPGKRKQKRFLLLQMMEHYFESVGNGEGYFSGLGSRSWQTKCREMYQAPFPMLTMAKWSEEELVQRHRRTGPIHIVGSGVNLEQFPISIKPKDESCVLVDGWVAENASKDAYQISPKVAKLLKEKGYRILAISNKPAKGLLSLIPDEFYINPDLKILNDLYERATVLVKASIYDFRASAPLEAMTKGTVTARAILKGDDDLIDHVNCLRSNYHDEGALFVNAMNLLTVSDLRNRLASACLSHVQTYTWDYWMDQVEKIIWS